VERGSHKKAVHKTDPSVGPITPTGGPRLPDRGNGVHRDSRQVDPPRPGPHVEGLPIEEKVDLDPRPKLHRDTAPGAPPPPPPSPKDSRLP
jgi:hypothetical protein